MHAHPTLWNLRHCAACRRDAVGGTLFFLGLAIWLVLWMAL